MKKLSEYSGIVNAALLSLGLDSRRPASLYFPAHYGLTAGGKRLRPALTLMAAEAFGASEQEAMHPALAMEMFHNFTLLHDDVMDRSEMRRGRQTVHAKWDEATAILSGDAMLTLATQLISDVPDDRLRPLLDSFNRMALDVYEGQALDMEFEHREDVTLAEYIEMVRLKTGALLGACAYTGAIIAGASPEDAEAMREYGEMLGIAFQIEDDWLDTFGDAATFGKPIGGDINNAKKTYLLLAALEKRNADSEALRAALQLPAGELRVKTVTRIYQKMEISDLCRHAVASYSARALAALRRTKLAEDMQTPFRQLLDKLTGRRK